MKFNYKDIRASIIDKSQYVRLLIVIFYSVGLAGLLIPFTQPLYMKLFPLAIILSLILILVYHESQFDMRSIGLLLAIGLIAFFIEVAGVKTHIIFGHYNYGNTLGIKLFETPLLIGANWVMLSYAGSSVARHLKVPAFLEIIAASILMVLYDVVLEQIAPVLEMWKWSGDVVPFRNYLAWFLIALFFQIIIRKAGLNTRNSIVNILIISQLLFFIILIFTFNPIR